MLGIIMFFCIGKINYAAPSRQTPLTISFINVGQGDSILVQTPNNHTMLIDAGVMAAEPKIIYYLNSNHISRIDALVATNTHKNHIGGIQTLIYTFPVARIYLPNISSRTVFYQETLASIKTKRLPSFASRAGTFINIDPSLIIEILAPLKDHYLKSGDYSTVIKITYDKTSVLFMGDVGQVSEREMLKAKYHLHADVLKVGRHGSVGATTEKFLKAVSPVYAIISVGANNKYGFPNQETLQKLKMAGVKLYRTDINGTIKITSDGKKVSVYPERIN